MFRRLVLAAMFITTLGVATFVAPDSADARRYWRRPYVSYYYGPPRAYYYGGRPYRSYYYGSRYYRPYRPYYRSYYYGYPGYYYGPRSGISLSIGF
jgi:hypothetical protein